MIVLEVDVNKSCDSMWPHSTHIVCMLPPDSSGAKLKLPRLENQVLITYCVSQL